MSYIDHKQTIYLNSHDRYSGTDGDAYYLIELETENDFTHASLLNATIPKSYYNSISGRNYMSLIENSSTVTITLPVGNYNKTGLSAKMSTILTTGSPNGFTYVCSYDNPLAGPDTGKYTFTVSGNSPSDTISFSFDSTSTLNELLGFNNGTSTFSGSTLISTNVINLQPFQCIQVHCSLVDNPQQSGVNTDILQNIVANAGIPSYGNISFLNPEPDSNSAEVNSTRVSKIRIWLTDEDNINIDLNGVPCQFVIMFWKKSKSLRALNGFIKYILSSDFL